MNKNTRGLLSIHFAVLLFGLSGLFGKWISLSPLLIVLGRTFFAFLALGLVLAFQGRPLKVRSLKDLFGFVGLGGVLALHWGSFFQSIQSSTVALGLLTYSTFPLFVTFMEPRLFHERLRPFDVGTAAVVFFGLILVLPSFDFGSHITQGALWGVLSGFTFAVLSLLNRYYVRSYSSSVIAFYQNLFAALMIFPFFLPKPLHVTGKDIFSLFLLGVPCTALAHVLFIKGLGRVRAQIAGVAASLEPVYGILLALLLLGETPSARTIIGGSMIIGAAVTTALKPKNSS
ncbi:MAG: DMT family transporter [Deltaproteobacteria bacterium]|nr:DMT family transporter [Deltaproteobacteria bacterium]